jgi:adenylate kinase
MGTLRLVLMGPPLSGKGTQSRRLANEHNLFLLSLGELLRSAVAAQTHLGQQLKEPVESGELVQDPIVIPLVLAELDELVRSPPVTGFVLDGFPRSVAQAKALDTWATEHSSPLDAVVRLLVPETELLKRLRQRALVEDRPDDDEERFARRMELYEVEGGPLAAYYERRRFLVDVDGCGDEDIVASRIEGAVGRACERGKS